MLIERLKEALQSLQVTPYVLILSAPTLKELEDEIGEEDFIEDLESLLLAHLDRPITIAVSNNLPQGQLYFV